MVIAVVVMIAAILSHTTSQNMIAQYFNKTGTCYAGGTCLHEQTNTTFIILSVIAAIIFIIGFIIFRFTKYDVVKEKILMPKLSGDQKTIYDIIIESGGSCLQGEIVEKSKINKVKVSRILDKLEMRGLIERRRHGMSNLIVIKNARKA